MVRLDALDGIAAAGVVLIVSGLWAIFPPAALIVLGLLLLAAVVVLAVRQRG